MFNICVRIFAVPMHIYYPPSAIFGLNGGGGG